MRFEMPVGWRAPSVSSGIQPIPGPEQTEAWRYWARELGYMGGVRA